MVNTLVQLPKAQNEIFKAYAWYEKEQPGLGERFRKDLKEKINLIIANPLHYPRKGKYHETKTDTFPFLIIYDYRIRKKEIVIVSVFHMSRHPKRKY